MAIRTDQLDDARHLLVIGPEAANERHGGRQGSFVIRAALGSVFALLQLERYEQAGEDGQQDDRSLSGQTGLAQRRQKVGHDAVQDGVDGRGEGGRIGQRIDESR